MFSPFTIHQLITFPISANAQTYTEIAQREDFHNFAGYVFGSIFQIFSGFSLKFLSRQNKRTESVEYDGHRQALTSNEVSSTAK